MNFESIEKIAAAILYEGYILYPYRSTAIKNRQRWNFGTLYPRIYAEAQNPQEPFSLQAECIAIADENATIDIRIRFLQLISQGRTLESIENQTGPTAPAELTDPSLAWEEAVERISEHPKVLLRDLLAHPRQLTLRLGAATLPEGKIAAIQTNLQALFTIQAKVAAPGTCMLHLDLENITSLPSAAGAKRNEALPHSLVSAHILLGISGGEFVSMLEPQESYKEVVAACTNSGVFPVLVGTEPERTMMLCSPIILYDYPQIAPESEGDFFDGTEMDEMLTLRVLTLTDAEKEEMRNGDPRARKILERTENLTPEMMLKAHGVIRSLRQIHVPNEPFGEWNPFAETKAPPESVTVFGVRLRVGDRVRIWPQQTMDIMDMALKGKVAVIEAIEQDFEDQVQFAVVLDDDPGREFGMLRQPGHRFFYSPEEVEPVTQGELA
ncbi:MAG: hypothetical protein JWQ42_3290 [Edaphobacter sp.]|nr:hypothetical protein [Edaphobacter sp.]